MTDYFSDPISNSNAPIITSLFSLKHFLFLFDVTKATPDTVKKKQPAA